jgi:hypothetical protein
VVTMENISEYMMIQSALHSEPPHPLSPGGLSLSDRRVVHQ